MTWPFENDTSAITKKLAKKSLQSEKRRNLMVVIAVALASCLICFSIVMALSTRQIEKNHVEDTYEAGTAEAICISLRRRETVWKSSRSDSAARRRVSNCPRAPSAALQFEDDGRQVWIAGQGLMRALGRPEPEDALAARHAGQWRRTEQGVLMLRVDAVVQVLASRSGRTEPRQLRLRRYLERDVLYPARMRRERRQGPAAAR